MRVLQINTTYKIGSTGKIVAGIDDLIKENGYKSYVAYGYGASDNSNHYKIINRLDSYSHNLLSRLTDSQGLHSSYKTHRLIDFIESVWPDVIHLHNLHGNYLNYKILINYLAELKVPIVWTLHDCWPFTGHCAYFDLIRCEKWKQGCRSCPQVKAYPPALLDRSEKNYNLKSLLFTRLGQRLTLVPVSEWLADIAKRSFLCNANIQVIHNGIDLNIFTPQNIESERKPYVLGVAFPWDTRKGLEDFVELRKVLSRDIDIRLIGLSKKQIDRMPVGIFAQGRTESSLELAEIYSGAIAFINTTYEDNYPTVNLEAIACGTPVITYRTGGCPESVCSDCGIVVDKGNIKGLSSAISKIISSPQDFLPNKLAEIAKNRFDEKKCFRAYIELYNQLAI